MFIVYVRVHDTDFIYSRRLPSLLLLCFENLQSHMDLLERPIVTIVKIPIFRTALMEFSL